MHANANLLLPQQPIERRCALPTMRYVADLFHGMLDRGITQFAVPLCH